MTDLQEAIETTRHALDTTTEYLEQELSPNMHAFSLNYNLVRVGAIQDFTKEIGVLQESIRITSEEHPDRAMLFNHLGILFGNTYFITGTIADLDKAIQATQKAVNITPENDIDRGIWSNNLGVWLGERFVKTESIADLDKAVQFLQEAVSTTPKDNLDRIISLNNLAIRLTDRYSRTGVVLDREDAIEIGQEAIDLIPENYSGQETLSSNYGLRQGKYTRTGTMDKLKDAIQVVREALNTTPDSHPDRAMLLNHLGIRLGNTHIKMGMMANLEEAIQVTREAIDITPKSHPNRVDWLINLGIWLGERYLSTGAMVNLEEATGVIQEAVNMTPEDHPRRAHYLYSLGVVFGYRHAKTGAMADLEKAILLIREAVNVIQENHPDRITALHSLGLHLRDRYLRTGALADHEEATRVAQEAVNKTPEGHPDRTIRFHSLGLVLKDKYLRTQVMADLEEAIQVIQEAINTAPGDTPDRANALQELGNNFRDKYSKTEAIDDLEKAIRAAEEAVDTTPEDHPEQASRLHNLGQSLSARYLRTEAISDLKEAISYYQSALRQRNSPSMTRILAGKEILRSCVMISDWQQACEASTVAVHLIPKLTLRYLENSDKQHILSQVVGLSCDAAAVALHAGEAPLVALGLLEQGRGSLAASLEEMRTDILDLYATHPELADRFDRLRNELELPISQNISVNENYTTSLQARASRRYAAGIELDELIVKIRELVGFENFLLPPSEEEMRAAAKCGPIVVVNISEYRCDALLIEQHRIQSLALSRLKSEEVKEMARSSSLGSSEVLAWLWKAIANPILDTLGFTQPPSNDEWPHVWWIPTGALSKFPLHAAGRRHDEHSTDSVLDRVMSSYSSSIKEIIHGRQRRVLEGVPKTPEQMLLVAMQDTPENTRLRFAKNEIEIVQNLCKSMAFNPIKPEKCKEGVILHLPACKIFHFAGHGYTDDKDPLQSALLLEDWKSNRLTVASLLELNLRDRSPFLAYLSACGTGEIRNKRFFDESIHLISACQLAGYRHVIGTLWEVNDESCVDMAKTTYEEIRNKGMTDESVCLGLHKATRQLRHHWITQEARREHKPNKGTGTEFLEDKIESLPQRESDLVNGRLPRKATLLKETPLHWIPYVHFGV